MSYELENMIQPDGGVIQIEVWGESCSCYSDKDLANGYRNTFLADVYVSYGYGSFRSPHEIREKRFWCDNIGLYTYKKQKTPIYYWKSQNIEEDYENWSKDKNGYHIPLNEPRKLKKNYF